jgi:hypothetical protein
MTEDKHTPGPWHWQFNEVAGGWELRNSNFVLCDKPRDKVLQAAAPELLEALENAVWGYNGPIEDCPEWINEARAAIAKAKGQE